MKISILDAMVLVSRAVGAELAEAGLGGLLVDHGEIRISRAIDGWPVRMVWAEMSVQALGIVQPMRVQIDVEYGRMVGDHNAAIRAFVQGRSTSPPGTRFSLPSIVVSETRPIPSPTNAGSRNWTCR